MELVSVIIPTYNGKEHILETLDSVRSQSHTDLEIIVIDDGSSDGTSKLVSDIDERIKLISQANAGIAGARNTGLAAAQGDFIAFLDHDDCWHPLKTERQLGYLREHPECGVCYGEMTFWGGDAEGKAAFESGGIDSGNLDHRLSGYIYHELILTNYVLLGTAIFRREIIDRTGLFDLELPPADDWDFAVRAARLTEFAKFADPVTLYRQHPGMTSRKVPVKDHATDFRESLVARYGLSSGDGRSANPGQVSRRNFESALAHGHGHYKYGDPKIAVQSVVRAIKFRPTSIEAYLLLIQAALKSLFTSARAT